MAKKTHEEFMVQFSEKGNKGITLLGEYKSCKDRIYYKCNICGHDDYILPSLLLRGAGCKKCAFSKRAREKSKTLDKFKAEMKVAHPNIDVIGDYVTARIKIKCKCKTCGNEWEAVPDSLLRGCGCPKCAIERGASAIRKTHEQFKKELQAVNKDIEIIGNYVNASTPIKCKCKIDCYEWSTSPGHLLIGTGCPKCNKAQRRTQEEFVRDVFSLYGDEYTVLSEFKNMKTDVLMRHNKCGSEYFANPNKVLQGRKCYVCFPIPQKTTARFAKELSAVNKNIRVIGEYYQYHSKIQVECKLCGRKWETSPATLMGGAQCPSCSASSGEREVLKILGELELSNVPEHRFPDCKSKRALPFDFYLPDINVAIEYDGQQHFEPSEYFGGEKAFKSLVERDKIKTDYCKNNGIKLIRIPYTVENIKDYLTQQLSIL